LPERRLKKVINVTNATGGGPVITDGGDVRRKRKEPSKRERVGNSFEGGVLQEGRAAAAHLFFHGDLTFEH